MRIEFLAIVVGVTGFAAAAQADDYPPRKAGLWEVTVQGSGLSHTMKMCIDAGTDQLFHKMGADVLAKHCSRNDLKVNGATVTTESECKMRGSTVTTTSVTNFTGDSAYHTDIKTHFDPALLGKTDESVTQDAKWTGDCPADMKPGDFVMANGIKVNVKMLDALKGLIPGHKSTQQ
ncbi:MAG TPA: DUF3617 family protein [Methylovirgula sp.]|nr:DUF3617 family protein [Methylovirgula sp.]